MDIMELGAIGELVGGVAVQVLREDRVPGGQQAAWDGPTQEGRS